ncbi:hypothetical protein D8M17_03460 [Corynebacterium pseudodiphtheriticum]|nr:hypothetical protein D8M17_03460 [Corynebacterium pseudodiphtheriticum]
MQLVFVAPSNGHRYISTVLAADFLSLQPAPSHHCMAFLLRKLKFEAFGNNQGGTTFQLAITGVQSLPKLARLYRS